MRRKILLIEPNYKNKYPPIGLMKLATYHRLQGDKVEFFKGDLRELHLRLKLQACLKELKKVDKRIAWDKRKIFIKKYLQTRHTTFLKELITETNPNKEIIIETILRKHSKLVPVDKWDRIYITTLFTFYWEITIKTIEFSKTLVSDIKKIYVGGVMASLLRDEINEVTGIRPFDGLLDRPGILDENNDLIIDELPLDYSILGETEYEYPTQSAYFTYMTKGCTRKCAFCSVPKLEPTYKDKIPSIEKFEMVKKQFGEQRNLLLMDNNVLASPKFPEIIQEIKDMGFFIGSTYYEPNQLELAIKNLRECFNDKVYISRTYKLLLGLKQKLKGEKLTAYENIMAKSGLNEKTEITKSKLYSAYKQLKKIYEQNRSKKGVVRYVDFNQGTDARYVTDEKMKLMSEIPIRPLRIAFDHISIKDIYIQSVELAAKYNITELSNYILYNFHDKPEDFYERLKINIDLGKRLNINIFSFPMKYIPLFGEEAKHRRYIGKHWNRKFIRAVQSILNATKGIVAPGYDFFCMAFGKDLNEFMDILWMPEAYIINRTYFEKNGMTDEWRNDFNALNIEERLIAEEIIKNNIYDDGSQINNPNIMRLLSHYLFTKGDKKEINSYVRQLRNKYNRMIKKDIFINLTLTHDFDQKQRAKLSIN